MTIERQSLWAIALVLTLPVASCGGAQSAPDTPAGASTSPAAPSAAPAPVSSGPSVAWDSMSKDQKKDYMKKVFFPKMKDDFVIFNASRYSEMKCATCHGDGAKDGSFTMPNPGLPKLSVEGMFKKHMEKTPEITKFMMQTVVSHAATLVGEQPYDPKTQQGFGCMECHTMEK